MILSSQHPQPSRPSLLKPDNKAELLTDILCCWLLSFGVLLAMRQLFRFDHPLPLILLHTTVALAVIVLLTRKWWLIPVLLTGASVVLFLLELSGYSHFLSYTGGLLYWWMNRFPIASGYNTPATIQLVLWLIVIAVCTIAFFLLRRVQQFLFLFPLASLLFVVICINGFRDNYWALFFISAGIFPVLARSYRLQLLQKTDDVLVPLRRNRATGILICVVCALLARAMVPADTSSWKSDSLYEAITGIQGSLEGGTGSLTVPYTLNTSGLQPNGSQLGGDLVLQHNLTLKVNTSKPSLMKSAVYDTYTGSSWTVTNQENVELSNDTQAAFYDTFDVLRPRNTDGTNPLNTFMSRASAEVSLLNGGYSLFVSDRVYSLSAVSKKTTFYFHANSKTFSLKRLPVNYKYQYSSIQLDRRADNFTQAIAAVESQTDILDENYQEMAANYTQLPDSLPSSVREKAKSIVGGIDSPYAQSAAIEKYLSTNYTYTLTPGDVPENEDFVNYFLKTGKGYCVYFASAMVVMTRSLGIPSRFVIGYGLQKYSDTSWRAYSDTAHAWVECYIRGVGWVTFDPTAGSNYTSLVNAAASENTPATEATGDTTTTSLTTTAVSAAEETTTAPAIESPPLPSAALWLGISAGMVLILLLAALIFRIQRRRDAYRLTHVRARFRDNASSADYYYTDLLRQLAILGYKPEIYETIYQHGARVSKSLDTTDTKTDDAIPAAGPLIENAFAIVMNWRYGYQKPTDSELEHMAEVHEALEERVRRKLSPLHYFLKRNLFLFS